MGHAQERKRSGDFIDISIPAIMRGEKRGGPGCGRKKKAREKEKSMVKFRQTQVRKERVPDTKGKAQILEKREVKGITALRIGGKGGIYLEEKKLGGSEA